MLTLYNAGRIGDYRTDSASKQYRIATCTNQRVLQPTVAMTVMIQGVEQGHKLVVLTIDCFLLSDVAFFLTS